MNTILKQLHSNLSSVLICGLLVSALFSSCSGKKLPEKVDVSIPSVTVQYVHYTEAGIIVPLKVRDHRGKKKVIEAKDFEMAVLYGTEKESLTKKAVGCISEDNKSFSAVLSDLEDGVIYYFKPAATYGSSIIEGEVDSLDTMPQGPVDLDLASGNKWDSRNIGADYPDENGLYFAWGETESKNQFDWTTYKWSKGAYNKITKYCLWKTIGYEQFVDKLSVLEKEDDAVIAKLGEGWYTPNVKDWTELIEECIWTNVSQNDYRGNGWIVKSKKDPENPKKRIFLPYAGQKDGTEVIWYCEYWTSETPTTRGWFITGSEAYCFKVTMGGNAVGTEKRCYGIPIRAVYK